MKLLKSTKDTLADHGLLFLELLSQLKTFPAAEWAGRSVTWATQTSLAVVTSHTNNSCQQVLLCSPPAFQCQLVTHSDICDTKYDICLAYNFEDIYNICDIYDNDYIDNTDDI